LADIVGREKLANFNRPIFYVTRSISISQIFVYSACGVTTKWTIPQRKKRWQRLLCSYVWKRTEI